MGRNALILVVGFAIITGVMRLSLHRGEREVSQIAYARYHECVALNAAHSGAHLALEELRLNPDWRDGYTNLSMFGADVDVRVAYEELDCHGVDPVTPTWYIYSQGSIDGDTAEVELTVRMEAGEILGNINACVTANTDIRERNRMLIDGRDHIESSLYSNWNWVDWINHEGTYAVITTGQLRIENQSMWQQSQVAGTDIRGNDLMPRSSNYESIVLENYVWEGDYPQTPEEVLGGAAAGFPVDYFKTVAQSGYNGSQYVTNPQNLTFPLRGVTYVELPSGGQWDPAPLGSNSEGLLIVHNGSLNARISDIRTPLFSGLIVADEIEDIEGDILGAVFVLSPQPSSCIGSGQARILFSRKVLRETISGTGMNVVNIKMRHYYE